MRRIGELEEEHRRMSALHTPLHYMQWSWFGTLHSFRSSGLDWWWSDGSTPFWKICKRLLDDFTSWSEAQFNTILHDLRTSSFLFWHSLKIFENSGEKSKLKVITQKLEFLGLQCADKVSKQQAFFCLSLTTLSRYPPQHSVWNSLRMTCELPEQETDPPVTTHTIHHSSSSLGAI